MAQILTLELPAEGRLSDIEDFITLVKDHGATGSSQYRLGLADQEAEDLPGDVMEPLAFVLGIRMPKDAKRYMPSRRGKQKTPEVQELVEERKAKRESGEEVPGHVPPKKPAPKKATAKKRASKKVTKKS